MNRVKVLGARRQSHDTVSLLLEKPEGFVYHPGQFVVVEVTVNDKPMRRSYSLSSAPREDDLEIVVRAQPKGRVSPVLCSLQQGDEVGVLGPFGNFTLESRERIYFWAAGTGIAPSISFLRHLEDPQGLSIIYSSRAPDTILYRDELEDSPAKVIHTITRPQGGDWEGRTGRIGPAMIADISPAPGALHYICGPTAMVVSVQQALADMGVPAEDIRTEKYGRIKA